MYHRASKPDRSSHFNSDHPLGVKILTSPWHTLSRFAWIGWECKSDEPAKPGCLQTVFWWLASMSSIYTVGMLQLSPVTRQQINKSTSIQKLQFQHQNPRYHSTCQVIQATTTVLVDDITTITIAIIIETSPLETDTVMKSSLIIIIPNGITTTETTTNIDDDLIEMKT